MVSWVWMIRVAASCALATTNSLSVRSDSVLAGEWRAAIEELAKRETWDRLLPKIREMLPEYRLSKFQRALPDWAAREMLEAFVLDVEGAQRTAGKRAMRAVDGSNRP